MATPVFLPEAESLHAANGPHSRLDKLQPPPSGLDMSDPLSSTTPLKAFTPGQLPPLLRDADTTTLSQADGDSSYFTPMLAENERLRLSMLWYYTRGLNEDEDVRRRIQDKVAILKEIIGWDYAVCGLIGNDVLERVAAAGMPLGRNPRRECICAHTLQYPPGTFVMLSDMANDWRFKNSPLVLHHGLRSYAALPLSVVGPNGEDVALGTLAVASSSTGMHLTTAQQTTMIRFADMLIMDIISARRWNRQKDQQRMKGHIERASFGDDDGVEEKVFDIMKLIYPEADISIRTIVDGATSLSNKQSIPLDFGDQGIWEDGAALDQLIHEGNHQALSSTEYVRAVVSKLDIHATPQALLVCSRDVELIFDDIDVEFVRRCSAILSRAVQDRLLKEASYAKEQFLRGVSHQLRTPIHGVLGSVDLLMEEFAAASLTPSSDGLRAHTQEISSTKPSEVLRTIRYAGEELMSTVNNIIKLHRWSGKEGPDHNSGIVPWEELQKNILDNVLPAIPDDSSSLVRIFFDNQLPSGVNGIMSDTVLLRECLQAIVLNALQATPVSEIVVSASMSGDGSSLIFDVEDDGRGIAAQDHGRIFLPYAKCDDHTRGIGLGLTLACKMAEAMNGSLELVDSVEGRGSHFRVELRGPTFAFEDASLSSSSRTKNPATFAVSQPDVQSLLGAHLLASLERSGFTRVSAEAATFTVVDYSSDAQVFQHQLSQAPVSKPALCLVPAMAPLREVKKSAFPHVLFAVGPFTSKKLDEIFTAIKEKSTSCMDMLSPAADPSLHSVISPSNKPTTTAKQTTTLAIQGTSTPTCLLVDDNKVNLKILRMYCERRKYAHRLAVDGVEAIRAYKDAAASGATVQLILLDLQMPNCGGLEACEQIRGFEAESGILPASVIFILTGQDSLEDRRGAIDAGANEYFVKPVSFKTLDRKIDEYFGDGTMA